MPVNFSYQFRVVQNGIVFLLFFPFFKPSCWERGFQARSALVSSAPVEGVHWADPAKGSRHHRASPQGWVKWELQQRGCRRRLSGAGIQPCRGLHWALQHSLLWHGMAWHGMAWHGIAWWPPTRGGEERWVPHPQRFWVGGTWALPKLHPACVLPSYVQCVNLELRLLYFRDMFELFQAVFNFSLSQQVWDNLRKNRRRPLKTLDQSVGGENKKEEKVLNCSFYIYVYLPKCLFALSQLKPCILALYLIISLDIHHNSTAFAQEPLFLKKPMLWNI